MFWCLESEREAPSDQRLRSGQGDPKQPGIGQNRESNRNQITGERSWPSLPAPCE